MVEIKIPFGRSADGAMVSIDAVVRGLDCACFCAACDAPLVARKGEVNQHHFAHYADTDCQAARETSLHKFAKQIICQRAAELWLPDRIDLGEVNGALQEQWLDGIRPDILLQFDAEPIAVEVRVAHAVPAEKISKLVRRRLATLEIDLSRHRNTEWSEQQWRDLILRRANRFWLVQPRAVVEELERQERERERRAEMRAAILQRDEEHQRLIAAEQERRAQAFWALRRLIEQQARDQKAREQQEELEYQSYCRHLEKLQNDRYLAGLLICADTEMHLREWNRRKAQAEAIRRTDFLLPDGSRTIDYEHAMALWGVEHDKMKEAANDPELSGRQAQWPHDGVDAGAGRAAGDALAGGPHGDSDLAAAG